MRHLQVSHHVVGTRLQVDAADGNVLATGPVAGQVHRHQVVQAMPWWEGGGVSARRLLKPCFKFLHKPTNDSQELVGATVGEEAAHAVQEGEGLGEGRHTLLAVLIGLQWRGKTSELAIVTPAVWPMNSRGLVEVG